MSSTYSRSEIMALGLLYRKKGYGLVEVSNYCESKKRFSAVSNHFYNQASYDFGKGLVFNARGLCTLTDVLAFIAADHTLSVLPIGFTPADLDAVVDDFAYVASTLGRVDAEGVLDFAYSAPMTLPHYTRFLTLVIHLYELYGYRFSSPNKVTNFVLHCDSQYCDMALVMKRRDPFKVKLDFVVPVLNQRVRSLKFDDGVNWLDFDPPTDFFARLVAMPLDGYELIPGNPVRAFTISAVSCEIDVRRAASGPVSVTNEPSDRLAQLVSEAVSGRGKVGLKFEKLMDERDNRGEWEPAASRASEYYLLSDTRLGPLLKRQSFNPEKASKTVVKAFSLLLAMNDARVYHYDDLKNARVLDLCTGGGGFLQAWSSFGPRELFYQASEGVLVESGTPLNAVPIGRSRFTLDSESSYADLTADHTPSYDLIVGDGYDDSKRRVYGQEGVYQDQMLLAQLCYAVRFVAFHGACVLKLFGSIMNYRAAREVFFLVAPWFKKVSFLKPSGSGPLSFELYMVMAGYTGPRIQDDFFRPNVEMAVTVFELSLFARRAGLMAGFSRVPKIGYPKAAALAKIEKMRADTVVREPVFKMLGVANRTLLVPTYGSLVHSAHEGIMDYVMHADTVSLTSVKARLKCLSDFYWVRTGLRGREELERLVRLYAFESPAWVELALAKPYSPSMVQPESRWALLEPLDECQIMGTVREILAYNDMPLSTDRLRRAANLGVSIPRLQVLLGKFYEPLPDLGQLTWSQHHPRVEPLLASAGSTAIPSEVLAPTFLRKVKMVSDAMPKHNEGERVAVVAGLADSSLRLSEEALKISLGDPIVATVALTYAPRAPIPDADIQLVMHHAKCSKSEALDRLVATEGDVMKAVLY